MKKTNQGAELVDTLFAVIFCTLPPTVRLHRILFSLPLMKSCLQASRSHMLAHVLLCTQNQHQTLTHSNTDVFTSLWASFIPFQRTHVVMFILCCSCVTMLLTTQLYYTQSPTDLTGSGAAFTKMLPPCFIKKWSVWARRFFFLLPKIITQTTVCILFF